MRPIRYFEEKLHILAPLFAAILMIDYVLINILLQFNDPTWWSDGKPDDLNIYKSLLETGATALLLFVPLMFSIFAVKRGPVIRIVVSLVMMPGILACSILLIPFHITAFFELLFLFVVIMASLALGLLVQIFQLHAVVWGGDRASAQGLAAAARAVVTLGYVVLGGLALLVWREIF